MSRGAVTSLSAEVISAANSAQRGTIFLAAPDESTGTIVIWSNCERNIEENSQIPTVPIYQRLELEAAAPAFDLQWLAPSATTQADSVSNASFPTLVCVTGDRLQLFQAF
jgi:hypothetical protein